MNMEIFLRDAIGKTLINMYTQTKHKHVGNHL